MDLTVNQAGYALRRFESYPLQFFNGAKTLALKARFAAGSRATAAAPTNLQSSVPSRKFGLQRTKPTQPVRAWE
jgi:hypothetical protein